MGRLPFFSCDWSSKRDALPSCVRLVDLSIAHLTIGAEHSRVDRPRVKCIKIEKAKAIADARGTHQYGISYHTHDGKLISGRRDLASGQSRRRERDAYRISDSRRRRREQSAPDDLVLCTTQTHQPPAHNPS